VCLGGDRRIISRSKLSSGQLQLRPDFGKHGKTRGTGNGFFPVQLSRRKANELIGQIHDRMPVIIDVENQPAWLGEERAHNLTDLLKPFAAERLRMLEISTRV
jgi:SOS response associated peptidase (SRAP)